jgi:hypothetical protein
VGGWPTWKPRPFAARGAALDVRWLAERSGSRPVLRPGRSTGTGWCCRRGRAGPGAGSADGDNRLVLGVCRACAASSPSPVGCAGTVQTPDSCRPVDYLPGRHHPAGLQRPAVPASWGVGAAAAAAPARARPRTAGHWAGGQRLLSGVGSPLDHTARGRRFPLLPPYQHVGHPCTGTAGGHAPGGTGPPSRWTRRLRPWAVAIAGRWSSALPSHPCVPIAEAAPLLPTVCSRLTRTTGDRPRRRLLPRARRGAEETRRVRAGGRSPGGIGGCGGRP